MNKHQARSFFLEKRKNIPQTTLQRQSLQIAQHFFNFFDLSNISTIHLFLSIKKNNEIDTELFINAFHEMGKKIVVPRINSQTREMEHIMLDKTTQLEKNNWGIPEPISGTPISEKEIEMILTPLLAFDKQGYRVGYGKGFYDRFFEKCLQKTLKIGLSLEKPIEQITDINQFDIPLNFCVTPEKVYSFR